MLKAHGFVAPDDDGNVAVNCYMILSFGPWRLDGNEDVVATEDGSGFLVNLLTGQKQVEVEGVFLVLVPDVEFVIDRAKDFMVNRFTNFAGQTEEPRIRHAVVDSSGEVGNFELKTGENVVV